MLVFKLYQVHYNEKHFSMHLMYVGGHENPLGIDRFYLVAVMNRVFSPGLQYSNFGGKDRIFGGPYNAPPDVLLTEEPGYQKWRYK